MYPYAKWEGWEHQPPYRYAEPLTRQNLMVLNGIPLNPDGVSSINLSDIPVQMLESVTLYRSHTPLLMMSNSMGGVVDMQTQKSPSPMLRTTADSWANLRVQGHTPFANTFGAGNLFFSGLQAPNAYPYFDNRNTPFNDIDDEWKTRVTTTFKPFKDWQRGP